MLDKYANCRNKEKLRWIHKSDFSRLYLKGSYGSGDQMKYTDNYFYICIQVRESSVLRSLLDAR